MFLINNGVMAIMLKKVHTKGRLLDQAYDSLQLCPVSKWELLLKKKEFAPSGSKFFPLIAVSYGKENHFYHMR